MKYSFDGAALSRRLHSLSRWKKLAFGAMILERSLPNFLLFQSNTGVAGGAVLRAALSKVWGELEGDMSLASATISADDCQNVAPDTAEFDDDFVSAALDAANIAGNLIEFINIDDSALILECAALLYESAYIFVGNSLKIPQSSYEFDREVKSHSIVQSELYQQHEDLIFLESLGFADRENFRKLLSRVIRFKYNFFDLSGR